MATNDSSLANRNIRFFIEAGLLEDEDEKVQQALSKFEPVLPSPAGNAPLSPQAVPVPEIARLYHFPTRVDGNGQTIGILELGGGFEPKELDAYFKSVLLPAPKIEA